LTVGDSPSNVTYPMVGIPDGLGALHGRFTSEGRYLWDRRYMTVLMDHELTSTAGTVRAHGQTGAFVSQWTINVNTLEVEDGADLIQRVYTWDNNGWTDTTGTTAFSRLCSANYPGIKAFYNRRSGKGYAGAIFMNGEETGSEGRAFAHVVAGSERGNTYQLPHLGRFSWENSLAHPDSGDKTIVVGTDDSTPGQIYVYVGEKQRSGNAVERAGLSNGKLFGVKISDGGSNYGGAAVPRENAGALNGSFTLVDLSDVATGTGAALQVASVSRSVTEFARPEDGAWDTKREKDFYFVTTGATVDGTTQTARLYRLRLNSLKNPTSGQIDLITDSASMIGPDGQTARSFDNITVDNKGNVIVQEDPGNSPYIAKTWQIDPDTGAALEILQSDASRFVTGGGAFLTQDEENSGVIEVTDLVSEAHWAAKDRRYFLADMQAHYANGPELIEGGQLYLIESDRQRNREDHRDDDRDHR
ncbi:MAG: alkaline phosphatase PhoX, partial [Steroidobacteraceae bacterium]